MSEPTRTFAGATHTATTDASNHAAASAPGASGFELLEELGSGGMGVVWRARDRALNRDVAVKVLLEKYAANSTAAARFLEEAQITGQLQHPGIPAVYHVGAQPDGRPFLAMKLIKGRTLDAILKAGDPINALAIFEAIAQAVGYAHAHGVIHRDLKPHNVMVGAFGEVQVMDWGLAKLLKGPPREPGTAVEATEIITAREGSHTSAGSILGTPSYMPPEQAAGLTDQVDARSDVFGLGAILCAMLTGVPPFAGSDAESIRRNAVRGKMDEAVAKLAACAAEPDVVVLCRKCLSFEPGERFADAGELAAHVAALRAAADERAREAELQQARAQVEVESQTKRRRVMTVAGGIVAAVLLLGIAGTSIGMWQANVAREREAERAHGEHEALLRAEKETARAVEAAAAEAAANRAAQRSLHNAKSANTIMSSIFINLDPKVIAKAERPLQAILVEKLDRAVQLLEADSIGGEVEVAMMQDRFGSALLGLGAYAKAVAVLERAHATCKAKLGPEHDSTLLTMNNLGTALQEAGEHVRAVAILDELRQRREKLLGPDHADTLRTLNNLGSAYRAAGRARQAMPLYEAAYERMKVRLGPKHEETLKAMVNFASCCDEVGDFDRALPMLEEALALMTAVLGPDSPDVLRTACSVALSYEHAGKHDRAIGLYEQTLARMKPSLGADHPDTISVMSNLGMAFRAKRNYDRALPLFEEALALSRTRMGSDHPGTMTYLNNLAVSLSEVGATERAQPLYEEALRRRKAKFGPDHPETLRSMSNLAASYWRMQRLDLSIPLFEEVLRKQTAELGRNHRDTRVTIANLGVNYKDAGRLMEALPLLEEVAKVEREQWIWPQLRDAYQKTGQMAKVADLTKRMVAVDRPKLPKESYQLASYLVEQGSLLIECGEGAAAEPLLRECLAIRRKAAADAWFTANAESMVGESLTLQKKYTEAEPLLLSGYEGLMRNFAKLPWDAANRPRDAIQRLVDLYTLTDQPKKAEEWRAKLPREFAPMPRRKGN